MVVNLFELSSRYRTKRTMLSQSLTITQSIRAYVLNSTLGTNIYFSRCRIRFIDAVNRVATDMPGSQVATVGQIEASPGAPNVIPGQVTLSLEIRDLEMEKIDLAYQAIETGSQELATATNTRFSQPILCEPCRAY